MEATFVLFHVYNDWDQLACDYYLSPVVSIDSLIILFLWLLLELSSQVPQICTARKDLIALENTSESRLVAGNKNRGDCRHSNTQQINVQKKQRGRENSISGHQCGLHSFGGAASISHNVLFLYLIVHCSGRQWKMHRDAFHRHAFFSAESSLW